MNSEYIDLVLIVSLVLVIYTYAIKNKKQQCSIKHSKPNAKKAKKDKKEQVENFDNTNTTNKEPSSKTLVPSKKKKSKTKNKKKVVFNMEDNQVVNYQPPCYNYDKKLGDFDSFDFVEDEWRTDPEEMEVNRFIHRDKNLKHLKKGPMPADNYSLEQYVRGLIDSINIHAGSGRPIRNHHNFHFIQTQFHNDYKDVYNAVQRMIPSKEVIPGHRKVWNLSNLPVIQTTPDIEEVKPIIFDFMVKLNHYLKNLDHTLPDHNRFKSGWDKIQEHLGLPCSIYPSPARVSQVTLVDIKNPVKYETTDEIKYEVDVVLEKNDPDVTDHMVLKGVWVIDIRGIGDEDDFFADVKEGSMLDMADNNMDHLDILINPTFMSGSGFSGYRKEAKSKKYRKKVSINNLDLHDIFIQGYMTENSQGDYANHDNTGDKLNVISAGNTSDVDKCGYFDYEQLNVNNMTDPDYIQKVLMDKHRDRQEEVGNRNAMLDEEGQEFKKWLPDHADYASYRGTRTIFDDMNSNVRYF